LIILLFWQFSRHFKKLPCFKHASLNSNKKAKSKWGAYSFSSLFILDVSTKSQKDHKLFNATYNLCSKKISNKKIEGSPLDNERTVMVTFHYSIRSYSIRSYFVWSNSIRSYSIQSYSIQSYSIQSYLFEFILFKVILFKVILFEVILFEVILFKVILFEVILFEVILFEVILFELILFKVILFEVILFEVISFGIILIEVISFEVITFESNLKISEDDRKVFLVSSPKKEKCQFLDIFHE